MVRVSLMSKSPLRLVSSPAPPMPILNTPAGRTITSAPAWLFAAVIASRSDSLPSPATTVSSAVLTAKVAGTDRSSSGSTASRCRRVGLRVLGAYCELFLMPVSHERIDCAAIVGPYLRVLVAVHQGGIVS